jgi:hypothetical protein
LADPASSRPNSSRYITAWEYGRGGTINVMLGGVSQCKLVDYMVVNDKVVHQIGIHPMGFEWERFISMIGSVFMAPVLEFSTFRHTVMFGTRGVNGKYNCHFHKTLTLLTTSCPVSHINTAFSSKYS